MNEIDEIISKIKNFEIQGSGNVYSSLIKSFKNFVLNSDEKNVLNFVEKLMNEKRKIFDAKFEPMTINTINFITSNLKNDLEKNLKDTENLKKRMVNNLDQILKYKLTSEEIISDSISDFIFDGVKILTHCYSKNVINGFKKAKEKGKNFTVINTETRPNFTGRMTSKDLNKLNIKNVHIFDFEIGRIIKEVDFVLIGCDAITREGIINKIGSKVIAIVANFYKKDLYVATSSLKFCKNIEKLMNEERKIDEVWNEKFENITIKNFAYDFVDKKFIKKIISEFTDKDKKLLDFDETIEKFEKSKYILSNNG